MKLFIFLFCFFFSFNLRSQNLVPNGGFENHRACPGNYTQDPAEFRVDSWTSPSIGTPDYFNACSHGEADVPHNWAGVSDPYEGVGYVGLYMWFANGKNYREYLQVELSESLVKDSLYYLEFHYKLSSYSKYSIDRIGLHLTDSLVRLKNDRVFKIKPTLSVVKDTALTMETGLWEEAKTLYKASGGEKFLLIGNFFDNQATHHYKIQFRPTPQDMVAQCAYYYIDDVSVVPKHVRDQQLLAQKIPDFEIDEVKANTNYVLKNISFQLDSYRLVPPSFTELDKVADYLLRHSDLRVQLFGHTDDQGSEKYNLKLSQARAKNVSEYLASVGVALDRIDHFGYGESQPVKEGVSEEARTLNRRVEIRFVTP
jgi:outer membrane protein OmpA-like peptidoglycan-associated protein